MSAHNIDWGSVLHEIAANLESRFELDLLIDSDVVAEIGDQLDRTLQALPLATRPNIAKVAGHVAFWIRKLKPISHSANTQKKLLVINELVAILVGAGICARYFDDTSSEHIVLPPRILFDWASSFRLNSHSPHSCAIAFEMLSSAT